MGHSWSTIVFGLTCWYFYLPEWSIL